MKNEYWTGCLRVEEGEKISFRTSEVPRMSQRDEWLEETPVTWREQIIFSCFNSQKLSLISLIHFL